MITKLPYILIGALDMINLKSIAPRCSSFLLTSNKVIQMIGRVIVTVASRLETIVHFLFLGCNENI